MKKSSDLALKMQRSRARFAGIRTTGIDQVNPQQKPELQGDLTLVH